MSEQTVNGNNHKRLHPLIVGTCASVMILALVGVAAMTGNLPGSSAEKAEPPQVGAKAEPPKRIAAAPAASQPKATARCADCGTVIETKEVVVKDGTGAGAVIGAVVGGVVGNRVSDSSAVGTVAGAGVGAVAGHQIERHAISKKRYEVVARMEDGSIKTASSMQPMPWKVGDRVRVADGKVSPVN